MAKRFKTLILALMCCSFALPVMANDLIADDIMAVDIHRYYNSHIAFNIGQAKTIGTCSSTWTEDASCKQGGVNYRIAFGHHFTPTWGMEISYGDFGRAEEKGIFPNPPAASPPAALGPAAYTWRWEAVGWEVAATGSVFLTKSFSLVGKLGFLRANIVGETIFQDSAGDWYHHTDRDSSNNLSAGLGAQYDFNRDYAARLQFEYFGRLGTSSKVKVGALSACMLLKF